MSDPVATVRRSGGVARACEVAATAAERRSLERSAERGSLIRLRRGVYGVPDLHPEIAAAARVGGRVAGISALRHHGLWVPPGPRAPLHVEVSDGVTTRVDETPSVGVLTHWVPANSRPRFGVAPLADTLRRATHDLPLPFAVAVLDSAFRATPLTTTELAFLASGWRAQGQRAARASDERSESGAESFLRILLAESGIPSTPQAPLPLGGGERADLLVGDRLLLECDSEAHHAAPENRRADVRRDAALMALGFMVLRFDYRQLIDDPDGVVAVVAAIVARGEHLSHPLGRRA